MALRPSDGVPLVAFTHSVGTTDRVTLLRYSPPTLGYVRRRLSMAPQASQLASEEAVQQLPGRVGRGRRLMSEGSAFLSSWLHLAPQEAREQAQHGAQAAARRREMLSGAAFGQTALPGAYPTPPPPPANSKGSWVVVGSTGALPQRTGDLSLAINTLTERPVIGYANADSQVGMAQQWSGSLL